MKILDIIKNNLFIQNIAAIIVSRISPFLDFSLAKYLAIKKAMYITAIDQTYGSYLEFGVFTGSSFNFAMKINKQLEKNFGLTDCEFVGFDSFEGFGEIKSDDKHPFFKNEFFSINEQKVLKNIKKCSKGQKYRIIKGYYDKTLTDNTTVGLKIEKSRVILIDCDLKESTRLALEFVKPSLQEGTIILFDDYIWYKGNKDKGEHGAFKDFKIKYNNIKFRRAFDYGYGSRAYIVSKID